MLKKADDVLGEISRSLVYLLRELPYAHYLAILSVILLFLCLAYGLVLAYKLIFKKNFTLANEVVLFCWLFVVLLLFLP